MISLLNIIKEVDITIIGVEPKLDESEYKNSIHLLKECHMKSIHLI